jgi:hypothetical protein
MDVALTNALASTTDVVAGTLPTILNFIVSLFQSAFGIGLLLALLTLVMVFIIGAIRRKKKK